MELKTGQRLQSSVCDTEVIVVRPPSSPVDLRCGNVPMVELGGPRDASRPAPPDGPGSQLGKRYADEATGLEVLCTKAGAGTLSLGEVALGFKEAKPLPSSD